MNWLEKIIYSIAPGLALKRMQARNAVRLQDAYSRGFDAASHSRRTSNWKAPATGASAEIQSALSFLRNRSRDLVRNNPYAQNAVNEIATSVIGTGIVPTPLGLSKLQERRIMTYWKEWASSTKCDADGHLNFYGLQELVVKTVVESGECLIRKHISADHSSKLPLKLQVLEGDYIDTTKVSLKTGDGGYIYYGVEFNSTGKIVAYWLYDQHPGDQFQYNISSNRIPANQIIHVFKKLRPGQFRGIPFGHSSMLRLKDVDDFEDAQLVRQKIAACFSVFVTETGIGNIGSNSNDDSLERVEPGIIEHLSPGKTITTATPPSAGDSYDAYLKGVLRGVAAGYNMDYVTLTGDLTAVNFSSGRLGHLKFQKNIQSIQWLMFIPMCCDAVWGWFIQISAIKGYVKGNDISASWTPPRKEMINPQQEVNAITKSIRSGLISWQEAVREQGYNPEELLTQMIADAKAFDETGLKPESDPRFDAGRQNDSIQPDKEDELENP